MAAAEEAKEEMADLFRWAAEIGVSDVPLDCSPIGSSRSSSSCLDRTLVLSHFPDAGGRGLAAARELRRGEMVLRVPRAALLTREIVLMRDEKLAACVTRHPRLSSTQILTVCLLAEVGKGRDSWWHPYLTELPRDYDTLTNFTQFEIQALQAEDAISVAKKAVLKSKTDWKEASPLMQELDLKPQLLKFRSWLWASATISSRTLHIPWDDAGCLCPVGDLFNYVAPAEEDASSACDTLDADEHDDYSLRLTDGGYEAETDYYCFYARQSYRNGEQVLLSYGTYTNLDLLEHYGFLLRSNVNDKAFIDLDLDLYPCNSWATDALYIQPDGSPSFALICALRLWATPANLRKAAGHLVYTGSMLSSANELFVMRWLAKQCRKVLEQMPTTIEDDVSILVVIDKMFQDVSTVSAMENTKINGFIRANRAHADYELPVKALKSLARWRLAVQWRLSHKKMLFNCISYCNEVSAGLSSDCTSKTITV